MNPDDWSWEEVADELEGILEVLPKEGVYESLTPSYLRWLVSEARRVVIKNYLESK